MIEYSPLKRGDKGVCYMRIGLLGGTFDPIHNGHLQVADKVLSLLKLDRVFFIPTGKSPHKEQRYIAPKRHRREMLSLALKENPLFTLCDIEIKSNRVSYTIDTISALKELYPEEEFLFIIGTDAFSKLSEWKEPERLLALCHFVIVPRIGTPFSRLSTLPSRKGKTNITFLTIPPMRVSASEIRTRIKEKKSVNTLLPKTVLSYIMRNGLYTEMEGEKFLKKS
jgi:nicotinate-nucleotide adenylyltransferase